MTEKIIIRWERFLKDGEPNWQNLLRQGYEVGFITELEASKFYERLIQLAIEMDAERQLNRTVKIILGDS